MPVVALPASQTATPHPTRLTRLVYRSRAVLPLAAAPLGDLLAAARRRNHREGVTGLLIADRGHYLQWLEGPPAGVATLMRSIALDRRHDSIEVVSEGPVAARCFAGWDMRLAADDADAAAPAALHLPGPLIEALHAEPDRLTETMATLGLAPRDGSEPQPGTALLPLIRGAVPRTTPVMAGAEDLARFLALLGEPGIAVEDIALPGGRGDGRRHVATLFEPAARRLGDLWMEDAASELEVTIALGRLQALVRHLGRSVGVVALRPLLPSVLVAPMPGEPHGLGATLASEWLWMSGWAHGFEIEETDMALARHLRAGRYDLLDLSLSPSFERLDGAGLLRRRLGRFREASANKALRIRLSGRLFAQRPWLAGLVGADAVSGTAHGLDTVLRRLAGDAARG